MAERTLVEKHGLALVEIVANEARIRELETALDDVARGSTHELVRYMLEKTITLEAKVVELEAELAKRVPP